MSELSEIKSLLKEQAAQQKTHGEKLDDIHFALFGNRQAGVKGIAAIQEQHSRKLREYERFKWIAVGATGSTFAGVIAWIKSQFGV